MALQWTTNRQFTAPSSADGVSVTPNIGAWVNSAYFTLLASISSASALTGIALRMTVTSNIEFEIDIATGAALSEVVIATIKGVSNGSGVNNNNGMYILLPVPIANIANAARLSCRIRTSGGSTVAWNVSVTYLKVPITGTLLTSAVKTEVVPAASGLITVPTGFSLWANG